MTKVGLLYKQFGLVLLIFAATVGIADAVQPTQQQLQLLQQLPQQQREMALRLLGGGLNQPSLSKRSVKEKAASAADATSAPDVAGQKDEKKAEADAVPRLKREDAIIVYFDEPQQDDVDGAKNRIIPMEPPPLVLDRRQMLFVLDKYGVLDLPSVGRIPLAGLNEIEAAARIALEPLLKGYAITVVRLPLDAMGKKALEPFGYELFNEPQMDKSMSADLPVPLGYVIGPGDTVYIQMFGKESMDYELAVARDGSLSFPGVGTIPVSGLSFKELKKTLEQRVAKQFIGVKAHISLGELRSIRVFLTGEVERPGAYTVSALSSITNALFVAGGIKTAGSLRKIELKRDGKTVARLDLYNLLLRGDNSGDVRLKPDDVIFVPLVGDIASVSGEVRRPAIYELAKEKSVAELLALAGGPLPNAFIERAQLERIDDGHGKEVVDVDLTDKLAAGKAVRNGDVLSIRALPERMREVVFLGGHVRDGGAYQWRRGMHLTDLIKTNDDLKPNADLDYVVIEREDGLDGRISVFSKSLRDAMAMPGRGEDCELKPRDHVIVFDLSPNRHLLVQPVIEQLQLQATKVEPARVVRIAGEVRAPGSYPLEEGMHISDLIRAGGYLKESAYALGAELTRYVAADSAQREIKHVNVKLADVLTGTPDANMVLQPYDQLTIKQLPQWEEQNLVEVRGEVRFPGQYPIRRGETMAMLLERAGGMTQYAYPGGSVFTREELQQREQEHLDTMANNLEAELATASVRDTGTDNQEAMGITKQLLTQLRATNAAGRLVINLVDDGTETYKETLGIQLKGGDKLFVPPKMQEVTVMGEVFYPTSHLYNDNYSWRDYIASSGGMTRKADKNRIYVIRANGAVLATKGRFFNRHIDTRPGDTIVVPLDAERVSPLKLMTDVSTIVYQLGLSVAAWNTVGLFK